MKQQQRVLLERAESNVRPKLDEISRRISNITEGPTYRIKPGDPVSLGVLAESTYAISLGQIRMMSFTESGSAENTYMVSISTLVLVKDKLLALTTITTHRSSDDIKWAQDVTHDWIASLRKQN